MSSFTTNPSPYPSPRGGEGMAFEFDLMFYVGGSVFDVQFFPLYPQWLLKL